MLRSDAGLQVSRRLYSAGRLLVDVTNGLGGARAREVAKRRRSTTNNLFVSPFLDSKPLLPFPASPRNILSYYFTKYV